MSILFYWVGLIVCALGGIHITLNIADLVATKIIKHYKAYEALVQFVIDRNRKRRLAEEGGK